MKKSIGCLLVLAALGGEGVVYAAEPQVEEASYQDDAKRDSQISSKVFAAWTLAEPGGVRALLENYFKPDEQGNIDLGSSFNGINDVNDYLTVLEALSKYPEVRRAMNRFTKRELGVKINLLLATKSTNPEFEARLASGLALVALTGGARKSKDLLPWGVSLDGTSQFDQWIRVGTSAITDRRVPGFGYSFQVNGVPVFSPSVAALMLLQAPGDENGLRVWKKWSLEDNSPGIFVSPDNQPILRAMTSVPVGSGMVSDVVVSLVGRPEADIRALAAGLDVLENGRMGREILSARITKEQVLQCVGMIAGYKNPLPSRSYDSLFGLLAGQGITNRKILGTEFSESEYRIFSERIGQYAAIDPRLALVQTLFGTKIILEKEKYLEIYDASSNSIEESIQVSFKILKPEYLIDVATSMQNGSLIPRFVTGSLNSPVGRDVWLALKAPIISDKIHAVVKDYGYEPDDYSTANIIAALGLWAKIGSVSELKSSPNFAWKEDELRTLDVIMEKGAQSINQGRVEVFGNPARGFQVGLNGYAFSIFTAGGASSSKPELIWESLMREVQATKTAGLLINDRSSPFLIELAKSPIGSSMLGSVALRIGQVKEGGAAALMPVLQAMFTSASGITELDKQSKITKVEWVKKLASNDTKSKGTVRGALVAIVANSAGIENINQIGELLPKTEAEIVKKDLDKLKTGGKEEKQLQKLMDVAVTAEDKQRISDELHKTGYYIASKDIVVTDRVDGLEKITRESKHRLGQENARLKDKGENKNTPNVKMKKVETEPMKHESEVKKTDNDNAVRPAIRPEGKSKTSVR